jgi:hypothetical protein
MMTTTLTPIACYRRPDPETGTIHRPARKPGQPESPIGKIEYTADPALFFHAEKYRGSNEATRIAIMEAPSYAAGEALWSAPLTEAQRVRWVNISEAVMRCALWFALSQRPENVQFAREHFDGLDVAGAQRAIQQQLRSSPTRLVIAGSREMTARIAGYALIDWFVENRDLTASGHGITDSVHEVVSGNANGADSIGEEWAMRDYKPVAHFPADWDRLGKGAGFARNEVMERVGTHLLAFHLANSKGTANMVDHFVRAKKPYWRFTEKDVNKMRQMLADRPAIADDTQPSPGGL